MNEFSKFARSPCKSVICCDAGRSECYCHLYNLKIYDLDDIVVTSLVLTFTTFSVLSKQFHVSREKIPKYLFIERKTLTISKALSREWLGALSCLRQILGIESSLRMMKNTFYFTSKVPFVLNIIKFLSWLFGDIAKRLDKEDKVNFKFYDVTAWLTNDYNTHIAQYLQE